MRNNNWLFAFQQIGGLALGAGFMFYAATYWQDEIRTFLISWGVL